MKAIMFAHLPDGDVAAVRCYAARGGLALTASTADRRWNAYGILHVRSGAPLLTCERLSSAQVGPRAPAGQSHRVVGVSGAAPSESVGRLACHASTRRGPTTRQDRR